MLEQTHPDLDQTRGLFLGLALGDALGAPFEGGILERGLWKILGRTRRGEMRFTDDTQMSLDVFESFVELGGVNGDDLARRFAQSYRWSRGYGPGAARLLKAIRRGSDWRSANRSVFASGSFGNGGAMRAPVLAIFLSADRGALNQAARDQAEVTHAHPQGIEGAQLIALAAALALERIPEGDTIRELIASTSSPEYEARLECALSWIEADSNPSPKEVLRQLGCGIAAIDSCVTAAYLSIRFRGQPFQSMVTFAAKMGGDVDTVCAMAGAMWGAARGASALPQDQLNRLEQRERFENLVNELPRQPATHRH